MNYRKWIVGLLVFVLCLSVGLPGVRAAAVPITIELDGKLLSSDVPPYITASNVTLVPVAVVSRGLGATVDWNQSSKTATISKGSTVLKLTSGSTTALVDGASISLETSVQSRQGRVMVPLRFVGEQLGLQVAWNKAANNIALYSNTEIISPVTPSVPTTPEAPAVPTPTVPTPTVPKPTVPEIPSIPGAKTGKAMKGAWISTVFNLDWPSTSSANNADKQKKEFNTMLDKLQATGYNAVFVQVRPSGDSLYPSVLVPWSKVLTGTQGKNPGYDPLEYMVSSTHERGMEFHAWFNPFRATTDASTSSLASNHVAKAHPEWIVKAENKLYINPGIPEARQHIIDTVMEVVKGYDIDGVHLDDYFYPSGSFADDTAFNTYNAKAISSKGDWRRDNINEFIRQLGQEIHSAKSDVSYGVSPFGVWRNKKADSTGSDTTAGVSAYDDMYADTRTWIKNGWIDYIAPQIYWSLSFSAARYDKLVDWWVNEVKGTGVKLYIGQAAYKVGASDQKAEWQSGEQIINQLKYNEQYDEVAGSIMFRANDIVVRDPFGLSSLLTFYFKS
ncbi:MULTISPECIES: family 10 glycosylhydrolase [unclassified Paenibacillus]|uniref:family 10 glycosylhydrolase n=1 Tax=unclassified Paenibacillus TaxID=185978 RepID=UPI0004F644D7|nr:family 10 glycosylhydrolase [Paenibacillus sp. FSL H7-0357]AIQ19623.1 hypothetical protein H70357_25105 [Paenibacillus sp. FSL H7-0357]